MIGFFRRIRKKLADDNKPMKYMTYAVGEILLVVIGILIALQVNIWNEQRKDHLKLTIILHGVLEDLKLNSALINKNIDFLRRQKKIKKSFLNHEDYNSFTRDSLEKNLETFYIGSHWHKNSFDNIQNSGITNYKIYGQVMKNITKYYGVTIPNFESQQRLLFQAITREDNYWRYEQNTYEFNYAKDLRSYQSDEAAKKILISFIKSPRTRNILKIDYRRKEKQIVKFETALGYTTDLVTELAKLLK